MQVNPSKIDKLRELISENLRVQRTGKEAISYIDADNNLKDICSRQNHIVFAKRGSGKSLLLHQSRKIIDKQTLVIYLNCEDFKRHSFPNVLIELMDNLFRGIQKEFPHPLNPFGYMRNVKINQKFVKQTREKLGLLRTSPDLHEESVKQISDEEKNHKTSLGVTPPMPMASPGVMHQFGKSRREQLERTYKKQSNKLRDLDLWLPELKHNIEDFFERSKNIDSIYLQIDDFYHLKKTDQPFVIDYIHRLCKDIPIFFKIATLRHASFLFTEYDGQPIGAQERHDFQPINIEFSFTEFKKTKARNEKILFEFGKKAGMSYEEIGGLFKGEGFDRLVMAGGGVPRDTLSLLLEVLKPSESGELKSIGKDEIRTLSKSNIERRLNELKQDSEGSDQELLINSWSHIRDFCITKRSNIFNISEQSWQDEDLLREIINRLSEYRLIHRTATALSHKSQSGTTYQAYAIDIGSYAHFRKLDGKLMEIDLLDQKAEDKMRSAPIFDLKSLETLITKPTSTPPHIEGHDISPEGGEQGGVSA